MIVHNVLCFVKVVIIQASMPPLVVLGQPLCNLVWREARKTTTQAYRLRMLLLQSMYKVVKQWAGNRIIGVVQSSARAARRALILRRWTVVRAAAAAFTRYGRGDGWGALKLNSRRGGGDGVRLTHSI